MASVCTVPFSATTPWLVSTSTRVTVEMFSAASFAFTAAVILASSMFSPRVRPVVDWLATSRIMTRLIAANGGEQGLCLVVADAGAAR